MVQTLNRPLDSERVSSRSPMFRVMGILDDADDVRFALEALARDGVDTSKVDVLTGQKGERLPDRTGRTDGWRARLSRLFQRGAYEREALQAHERALQEGRTVVVVPVTGNGESDRVVEILRVAGGRYVLHVHPWNVALP